MQLNGYSDEQRLALEAAGALAKLCGDEVRHSRHVTFLALRLFDELQKLHGLSTTERFFLECAGLLHDIGWVEGWKGHHKTSLNIILRTTLLPIDNRERLIIGSIARYHTRALPSLDHDHFAALEPQDRQIVLMLSGILRLADSLDRTHGGQVENLRCKIGPQAVKVRYVAKQRIRKDEKAAEKGSRLLQMMLERRVSLEWTPV